MQLDLMWGSRFFETSTFRLDLYDDLAFLNTLSDTSASEELAIRNRGCGKLQHNKISRGETLLVSALPSPKRSSELNIVSLGTDIFLPFLIIRTNRRNPYRRNRICRNSWV